MALSVPGANRIELVGVSEALQPVLLDFIHDHLIRRRAIPVGDSIPRIRFNDEVRLPCCMRVRGG